MAPKPCAVAMRRANRDSLRMVQAEAAMALGDAGGALNTDSRVWGFSGS